MYTEATLKLDSTANHSSPEFDIINPPVIVVTPGQPVLLSMSATDFDGDSLSYELVRPLENFNSPVSYLPIPVAAMNSWLPAGTSNPVIDLNGRCILFNTQVAVSCSSLYKNSPFDPSPLPVQTAVLSPIFCSAAIYPFDSIYSASFPLPSYIPIDWVTNCQTNVPGGPYFNLDPQSGNLEFTLSYYNPNSAPASGDNRYAISILVKEWRRDGAMVRLLSQVRRETMVIAGNPSTNFSPRLAGPSGNIGGYAKEFVILAGSTLNYDFMSSDANSSDNVTMLSDAETKLPGATFTITNGHLPTGSLNWTPTTSQARTQPYYFNILLKDDASLRGYTVETIKVEVRNSNINSVRGELKDKASLTAFPNPFAEQVNFKLNNVQKTSGQLIIYNILGSEVDRIELNNLPSGEQNIRWKNASKIPAGQYMARLISNDHSVGQAVKFLKLK